MTKLTPDQEKVNSSIIDSENSNSIINQNIIIFLVDDDRLYLKALENQFQENESLTIKTFLTGEECLHEISLKPDVVVLDYFLNSNKKDAMDGLKTLVLLKKTFPETQVIMSSGNESAEVAINCMKLGAFDYIVKNEKSFPKLKQSIKKIFNMYAKEKEIIIWNW